MTLFYFRDLMWLSLSLLVMKSEERVEVNCGSQFSSRTGTISTPNYPQKYSPNLYCVWSISVSGNSPEIKLKFSDFQLPEKDNNKCTDFLSIYHGTDAVPRNLVGTYCGSTLPPTQLHKVNAIQVHFVSDEDDITDKGFAMTFTVSVESSSITTSQATAGIVAAIFCGIVFIGVATMRCIMMGACQQCRLSQNNQNPSRECVGTNETISNYVMDCPPSYRTVMEHPENFPTPHITPYPTPSSSARASVIEEQNDGELPPPYYCFATTATSSTTSTATDVRHATTHTTTAPQTTENRSQRRGITAHEVAERLLTRDSRGSITVVVQHDDSESQTDSRINDQQNEQSTDSSVDSGEDGERENARLDSSASLDYQQDVDQNCSSETDNHRDSHGTNNHRNGTNDQNGTSNQNGTNDQNVRNGINDQNLDHNHDSDGHEGSEEITNRSGDQTEFPDSDDNINRMSHQNSANRMIHRHDQHDNVTRKPHLVPQNRVQDVEVSL